MDELNICSSVLPIIEEVDSLFEVEVASVASSKYHAASEYESNSDTDDDEGSLIDNHSEINENDADIDENNEVVDVAAAAENNEELVPDDLAHYIPFVPAFHRRLPTRFFTEQFEVVQYQRLIASKSQSGYARERCWAQAMKEKYGLTGEDQLKEMLASKDHQSDHVVGPTLQGMPAEIRDVIFEVIFTDHWQGKTHPLIIALRGDQEMYQHAIVVYENVNAFRLGPKNDWLCFKSPIYKTLSITPLHHIRHLVVDMPQILRHQPAILRQAVGEKNMEFMATIKTMPNLKSLEMRYHSSHEVRLDKDMLPWIYRAITMTQVDTFRLTFTNKCIQVDGLRIGVLVDILDDHFGRLSRTPVTNNAINYTFEWAAEPDEEGLFYNDTDKPEVEYMEDMKIAFLLDRFPYLGNDVFQDENDEFLVHFEDPAGVDCLAYGLEVLDPVVHAFLNRTKKQVLKDRVGEVRRDVARRLGDARNQVKEEVRGRVLKVCKLFKGKEKPKSEHGRVRIIVPGINCDCHICLDKMNV